MASPTAKSGKPMPHSVLSEVPAMQPSAGVADEAVPADCERTRDLFTGREVITPIRRAEPAAGPSMAEALRDIIGQTPPRMPAVGDMVWFGVYNPGAEGQVTVRPAVVLGQLRDKTLELSIFAPGGLEYAWGIGYTPEPRWNHWTFPAKPKE